MLLSSATLPPALTEALFEAYREGRKAWQAASGQSDRPMGICCAWFDEYGAQSQEVDDDAQFRQAHGDFVRPRVKRLPDQPRLRLGKLAAVEPHASRSADVVSALAQTLRQQMIALHGDHRNTHKSGKTVSFGLVRMANINPLVAVAQALMALPSPDNYRIHYCVYHSQHPLAVRAAIEKRLDAAFMRHKPEQVWQLPEIKQALTSPEKHHLFVVLGTSVLEVGRDFDADWGIIEPSSMRSLIQFAGRIQRHRQIVPERENLVILERNVRALRGERIAYCRPGFETEHYLLPHHNLHELLSEEGYRTLNAIPRIVENLPGNALAALEHARLRAALLDGGDKSDVVAASWWRLPLTWNGELQRRTPFRRSSPQDTFFLSMEEEGDEPEFCLMQEDGVLKPAGGFCEQALSMADGVEPWMAIDYGEVLQVLAEEKQMELAVVSRRYGEITLRVTREEEIEKWFFHPLLGVFREYL